MRQKTKQQSATDTKAKSPADSERDPFRLHCHERLWIDPLCRTFGKCGLSRGFGLLTLWSLFLLVAAVPAYSQVFSFGAKVGVPMTFAYSNGFVADGGVSSSEDRFIIGPTAEVHLPFHLSLEVDALWRRSAFNINGGHFYDNSSVNDWQIPLLAKYEMKVGPIRPFVDGGVVYRHVSVNSSSYVTPTNANTAGFSVGGGVTLKLLHLRLSPEVRYTHWPTPSFADANTGVVQSTSNQADLLVGFTF